MNLHRDRSDRASPGEPRGGPAGHGRRRAGLRSRGVLGIYPEGTRSRDGLLHRGSLGPARLALATGAPIVPVGLIGTEAVQEVGRRTPRIGLEVIIRFGPPFFVSRPISSVNQKGAIRDATVRLMEEIASLSGQERAGRPVRARALAGTHG